MIVKYVSRLAFVMALLCSVTQAQAALIDNGTYITDTNSGLDWLEMSFTKGRSYNQVVTDTDGGIFDEWSIATELEVFTMFSSLMGFNTTNDAFGGPSYSSTSSTFNQLENLFGQTRHSGNGFWAHFLDDGSGNTSGVVFSTNGVIFYSPNGFSSPSSQYPSIGTFLVRPSGQQAPAVSAPSALLLMGLSLAFFAARRRA